MEFSGNVRREDLDDIARLIRPKRYWLRLVWETWHGAALMLAILWATVAGFLGQTHPNWTAGAVIWAVIAGIISWTAYSVRRERTQLLTELRSAMPERFTLASGGIRWTGLDGRDVVVPWSDVTAWRESGRVVVLERAGRPAAILPVGDLTELERQRVRDLIRSQIPHLDRRH
jgi:hypothetical protein